MKRIKSTTAPIVARAQAEQVVGEIAYLSNRKRCLIALMDERIKAIKDEYVNLLGSIEKMLPEKLALVQDWAEAHPEEFHGLKSLQMVHGTIGWRKGNPTLTLVSGWSWKKVLECLTGSLAKYQRNKPEVDKEQLLADRELLGAPQMRAVGVKVTQEEPFFCEPNLTEVETRQTAAA